MASEVLTEGFFAPVYALFSSSTIFQSVLFRLAFFTFVILAYSLFVFYSYKLFSRKNLFDFDFKGYLYSEHPALSSFFGFIVYLVEYIIILPFFVIIWFSFYSIFLLILATSLEVQTVLLICTALIAAIRISSFVSQNLSQELAKMIPFTLLTLAIIGERFFSLSLILERFTEIPALISSLPIYLLFIFVVETIFRFFDAIQIFVLRE